MTGRLHTCPAPTLSGVGSICGPLRPAAAVSGQAGLSSITFTRQLPPLTPYSPTFAILTPSDYNPCSHMGSNLHAQTVKSAGIAAEGY